MAQGKTWRCSQCRAARARWGQYDGKLLCTLCRNELVRTGRLIYVPAQQRYLTTDETLAVLGC